MKGCPGHCAMHHACSCPDKLDRHPTGNVEHVPPRLVRTGIYLITTTDAESVVGEYAGMVGGGRKGTGEPHIVIIPGPLSPVHIPERKVADAVRLG